MTVSRIGALFAAGIAAFVCGCSAGANIDLIDELPVPPEAEDVQRIALAEGTYQLYYKARDPYPSTKYIGVYRDFLGAEGWVNCSRENKGWDSYQDRSGEQPLLVHELSEYWVRDDALVILSARYYSTRLSGGVPDNEEQHVIVWMQESSQPEREVEKLGGNCHAMIGDSPRRAQ